MPPIVANLTTTIRRYSLVVEADERRAAALNEWKAAAEAVLVDRNSFTEARLIEASTDLKKANMDFYSVSRKVFPQGDAQ
jgi:hypothetical protein